MAEPATSASVFEALGDPQRRQILQLLGEAESSVQGLAEHLPISRPAVSRHLRVLKSAGLVSEAPRGAQRIYRLRADGIDAIRDYLQGVWGDAAVRFRFFAENTERTDEP
jgi:DNA-binding transcriptional ArsR family regulator